MMERENFATPVADPRGLRRFWLGALVALLLSPYVAVSLWGAKANLIGFFTDDSFYYLKTARNVFVAGFATFDGVNPTNGFHPLYFLLVTALAGLVPAPWFLNAVFLLHTATLWLAIFLLLSGAPTLTATGRMVSAALLAFPASFLFVWVSAGMEASLVVLATVLLFNAWLAAARLDFASCRANVWLSVAMTVFMLARLDLILVLLPFIAWFSAAQLRVYGNSARAALLNMVSAFALPLVCGTAYIVFEIVTTGHVVPVSGVVKQIYTVPFAASWHASTSNGKPALEVLAAAPMLISALALFWCGRNKNAAARPEQNALLLAAVAVVIYYLYLATYATNFYRWYFAMPAGAGAWIALHWFAQQEFRPNMSGRMLKVAGVAAALVAFASNVLFVWFIASSVSLSWHLLQIAQKLEQTTRPCDVAAVFDAGIVGYFSNRRVINLDGLANNYTYLNEYLLKGKLLEYLEEQGVSVYLLREQNAVNSREIASGQYEFVQFPADPRIKLRRQDELFRYIIPGDFTVIAYRYDSGNKTTCAATRAAHPPAA
jgi:hypothetical protein